MLILMQYGLLQQTDEFVVLFFEKFFIIIKGSFPSPLWIEVEALLCGLVTI